MDIQIPQEIDIYNLGPTCYRSDKNRRLKDGMAYITSLLMPGVHKKKQEEFEKSGFINLNAEILKHVIGDDYNVAIKMLQEADIITTDNRYMAGMKSRGYRLLQPATATQQYTLTDKGINKRLVAFNKKKVAEQKKSRKNITHLTNWFSNDFIAIDMDATHDYIEGRRQLMFNQLKNKEFKSKKKKQEAEYRMAAKYLNQKHCVKAINSSNYQIIRDLAGRLHTPITALKSELRSFLTLCGYTLGSVDIKSSQPYLFQLLLNPNYWKTTNKLPITLYKSNPTLYKVLRQENIINSTITLLDSSKSDTDKGLQENQFKNIDWTADFYTDLGNRVNGINLVNSVKSHFLPRKMAKRCMMLLLYDTYQNKQPRYYKAFKELFPLETKLMDTIKLAGSSVFPMILQNVEAEIVLERATKNLAATYPDLPLLTIHDSILAPVSAIPIVKEELHRVLLNIIGTEPGLKVELYDKQKEFNDLPSTVEDDFTELYNNVTAINQGAEWLPVDSQIRLGKPLLYRWPVVEGITFGLTTRYYP
jgi:hypothetical protein